MEIYSMHLVLASVMFLGIAILGVLLVAEYDDHQAKLKAEEDDISEAEFFAEFAEYVKIEHSNRF